MYITCTSKEKMLKVVYLDAFFFSIFLYFLDFCEYVFHSRMIQRVAVRKGEG